jgi:hypothetical protein
MEFFLMRLSPEVLLLSALVISATACTTVEGPGVEGRSFHADPDRIDFSYIGPGSSTDPIAIDLINATSSEVEIQDIRVLEGTEAFSLFSQPTTLPVELGPGDELQISAYFAPPAAAMYLGTIRIITANEEDVVDIFLGGCSTDPDCDVEFEGGDDDDAADDDDVADDDDAVQGDGCLVVTPSPVDFGQIPQNASAVEDLVSLSNSGEGTLNVSSITLLGPDAGQFGMGGFQNGSIAPGSDPVTLAIQFTAVGSLGVKNATLVIESDSACGDNPLEVSATAEVIEDCGDCLPILEVVGASITPGLGVGPDPLIHVGGLTAGTTTVTIRNVGFGTLSVAAITEGGQIVQDNPAFSYTGGTALPFNLGSGEEATLEFTIGSDGCEVINFDGAYAFSLGIPPDPIACFGG